MATLDLSLALLGPPVVRRDGAPVSFDTRKATALLALLAVTGREHSREQLADLFWPEADSAKGRASLRRTLSVTAAAMGEGLRISRAAVALDPALVRVDVREFSSLIGRPDAASLERAASLYRDASTSRPSARPRSLRPARLRLTRASRAPGGRRPASGTCCGPGCRRSARRPGRC
jgi:DNA-binding SARP family transcriptional activator